MDMIQDFIYSHASPKLLSTLTTHSATYYRILSALLSARWFVQRTFEPLVTRLINAPDLQSFLLLLLVLFVSFKVVDLLWRTIIFWVRIALRLAFWAAVLALGVYVWSRGTDGVANDLGWVTDEWKKEYAGYQQRNEMAKAGQQVKMGGAWR